MLKLLKKYLYTIPIEKVDVDNIDYIRIKAANKFIIIGLFLLLIMGVISSIMHMLGITLVCSIIFVALIFSFKLNQVGQSDIGIPFFIFVSIAMIFLSSFFIPYIPGVSILYIALIGMPLLFINDKQRFLRYFLVLLCVIFYFFAEFAFDRSSNLPDISKNIIGILVGAISFTLIILLFKFWEEVNILARSKLVDQQTRLIQSNQLSSLGIMSAGIAHEINNPLSIIQGYCYKLEQDIQKCDSNTAVPMQTYLNKQMNSIVRIGKIISGLRVLLKKGEGDPMVGEYLAPIIEESVEFFVEKLRAKGITLEIDNKIESARICCQKIQISQVFINLIGNAIDALYFTKADQAYWIKISIIKKDNNVEINVIDSGPGIPNHIMDKVLTPFFTTKEIGKGTGLGLSISKKIIEAHSGELSIDKKNIHTCFQISLPLIESDI